MPKIKPKSRKQKTPKLTPNQIAYEREYKNLVRRIRAAEKQGFQFYKSIYPERHPQGKIYKKDIEAIRQLRGEKLWQKAWVYSEDIKDSKPDELGYRPQQYYETQKAIRILKERRRQQNIANLKIITQDFKDIGEALYNEYSSLSTEQEKNSFIRSLSDEHFEALNWAISHQKEDTNGRDRNETGTSRQKGKDILPDEGGKYPEEEDYYPEEYYDYEGAEENNVVEPQRTKTDEEREIERKNREYTDQKLKEWQKAYETEKVKPKAERSYVHEGDAIYANILDRIQIFESEYDPDNPRTKRNKDIEISFKKLINDTIKREGFNTLMKRLDGFGISIDNALETILYHSDQNKIGEAYVILSEIITGRALTQQEAEKYTAHSEYLGYDDEDEEMEGYHIEQLL